MQLFVHQLKFSLDLGVLGFYSKEYKRREDARNDQFTKANRPTTGIIPSLDSTHKCNSFFQELKRPARV